MSDPIADYLTRIRNALKARHRIVEVPSSKLKKEITRILYEKGYILNYKFEDNTNKPTIKIALKYDPETREPAIRCLKRISKPSLRIYTKKDKIPRVLNNLGIAIISTSQGVMTDKEARVKGLGGEVICYVY